MFSSVWFHVPENPYDRRFLTDQERQQLRGLAAQFENNLDADEVLVHLFARGVISHRKRAEIEAERTSYDKSRAIFDHIYSSPYDKVMIFRDILNETGQEHLAELIDFDQH